MNENFICGLILVVVGLLLSALLYHGSIVYQNPPTYYSLLVDSNKTIHEDFVDGKYCENGYLSMTTNSRHSSAYVADESGNVFRCKEVEKGNLND